MSYSQTEGRLREWLNRRRVNKSVGQIPKLEQELSQVEEQAEALSALCGEIAQLEETLATLNYKHWYYETAKEAGSCGVHDTLTMEDIPPELLPAYRRLKKL